MSSFIILSKFLYFALHTHKVVSLLQSEAVPHEGVSSQAKAFLEESCNRVEMVVTPPESFQN